MKSYSGYLTPYLPRIRELAEQGQTPMRIARKIYDEGARSPWGGSCYGDAGNIASMSGIIRTIVPPTSARQRALIERLKYDIACKRSQLAAMKAKLAIEKHTLRDLEKLLKQRAKQMMEKPPVPPHVKQAIKRREQAVEMRRNGKNFLEIGEVMGVGCVRARQMVLKAARDRTGGDSPEAADTLFRQWAEEGKRARGRK